MICSLPLFLHQGEYQVGAVKRVGIGRRKDDVGAGINLACTVDKHITGSGDLSIGRIRNIDIIGIVHAI